MSSLSQSPSLSSSHLFWSESLTPERIQGIINEAIKLEEQFKADPGSLRRVLANRLVTTVFFENSTRTRLSFELAATRLGADVQSFQSSGSSVSKGESLFDTLDTLIAMGAEALVLRHAETEEMQAIETRYRARVHLLNAGSGKADHPTQGLLDLMTLVKTFGWEGLEGLKLTILGDLLHSRVLRANLSILAHFGIDLHLCAPSVLMDEELQQQANLTIHHELKPAIDQAHVVMALRLQRERMAANLGLDEAAYIEAYQLKRKNLVDWAALGVKVMHPGPVNRDVELSAELVDDPDYSLILSQVNNGVWTRMACLKQVFEAPFS